MIEISHATKTFGTQTVLDDLSLTVGQGERVIVLGQNGAGKTTLLRCLLGEYRLDCGSVRIAGADPVRDRRGALSHVAFIPQLPPPLPFSIRALIEYAEKTSGIHPDEVAEYCSRFGLTLADHLNKPFVKLSGGMKQKVLASLAFSRHSPIMFFDEPTANLDAEGRATFGQIIREKQFRDATIVFISHRVEELNTVLNRAVWLDHGKIVKDEVINA